MSTIEIRHGDCFDVLKTLDDNSIGAVVTDPPYGISFMNKEWDDPETLGADESGTLSEKQAFQKWALSWLKECYRVMKPGAIIKVFGATRMYHRIGAAMVQAGFSIERPEVWCYGSGFPKSMNISKALEKQAGQFVPKRGQGDPVDRVALDMGGATGKAKNGLHSEYGPDPEVITDLAKQYKGYGTALKPAWEPFMVGRKPE
jgi:site-specific DNA-methyltransferase (adenine-specific)